MFWDSSALVPLLLEEPRSAELNALAGTESRLSIWWASPVECQTALARRHREGVLADHALAEATGKITRLTEKAATIMPTDEVRSRARRLAGVHPLRAGDALQLAAALAWCEEQPGGNGFVCLDERLREAARREGFAVGPAGKPGSQATILQDELEPYR